MAYDPGDNGYGGYQGPNKQVNYPPPQAYGQQQAEVVPAPSAHKTATTSNGDYEALLASEATQTPASQQTGYRDLIWFVFFWAHAAVIIGLAGMFCGSC